MTLTDGPVAGQGERGPAVWCQFDRDAELVLPFIVNGAPVEGESILPTGLDPVYWLVATGLTKDGEYQEHKHEGHSELPEDFDANLDTNPVPPESANGNSHTNL